MSNAANANVHSDNVVVEGGFKTEFVGEVVSSFFSYDENYENGNISVLKWSMIDHDEADEHEELISIGSNWEPIENGDRIKPLKAQKGINANSTLGMIMARVISGAYGEECLKLLGSKSLRTASSWNGTVWQFGGVEVDDLQHKDEQGKPKKKIKRLPVEFLGISKRAGGNWEYGPWLAQTGQAGAGAGAGATSAGVTNAGVGMGDAAALLAQMQAQASGVSQPQSAAPANDAAAQLAAMQAQVAAQQAAALAAQQAQAQLAAAQAAAAQTTAAQTPNPNTHEYIYYKSLPSAKLADFVRVAKEKPDNNQFVVAAIGIDQSITQQTPEFTQALMSGKVWEELKLLGAGM